jgi:hypothetical protein
MPSTDIPPWDDELPADVPAEGELVTQHQHRALLRMVTDLSAAVRAQDIRIATLERGKPAAAAKIDNTQGDKLQSGQHVGKTRDWVVKNAPDYVVYLAKNGWATTRWGFTAEQIAAAEENPLLPILQSRRR